MEKLFSYGTLRDEAVQQALFGRRVDMSPDAIVGYRVREVRISRWKNATMSGGEVQKTIEAGRGEIGGAVLLLTKAELQRVDDYEPKSYARIRVPLKSGGEAWAYKLVDGHDPSLSHRA